jgi:hypothetical protein
LKLDLARIPGLPLRAGSYLIWQTFGSVLVNGAISFAFAWPMRHAPVIPAFGGVGSASLDTCLTAVLLSAFTVIIGTRVVKQDERIGVVRPQPRSHREYALLRRLPVRTGPRALLFAAIFSATGIPLGLAALALLGVGSMTFVQFATFKVLYACVLGVVVTPLNAALALSPDSAKA